MFDQQGVLIQISRQNEIQIKSFIAGVKEARRILCTTVYGQPARRAYDMGRKYSNNFMGLLKVVGMKGYHSRGAAADKCRLRRGLHGSL